MAELFSPLSIGTLTLRNRIVRSATAERFADRDGRPDSRQAEMYARLADGGVGLIITGHAYVDRGGKCHPEMLALDRDELIEPLSRLRKAAHAGGAAIAVQINHGGRSCDSAEVPRPVAPSPIPASEGRPVPRALTRGEIDAIATAFGASARRAREAGCDAVQIHGAHGYLVSQFLSPLANRRADRFGGPLENRALFLSMVAEAVRDEVGADYPVLIKLGATDNLAGGLTLEDGAEVAGMLAGFGIDAIEVSTGLRGAIKSGIDCPEDEAYLLPLARAVMSRTDLPVILVGGIRSGERMRELLDDEGLAAVSLCRPLICEPDLPSKLRAGQALAAACKSCSRCWPDEPGAGISCKDCQEEAPPPT